MTLHRLLHVPVGTSALVMGDPWLDLPWTAAPCKFCKWPRHARREAAS